MRSAVRVRDIDEDPDDDPEDTPQRTRGIFAALTSREPESAASTRQRLTAMTSQDRRPQPALSERTLEDLRPHRIRIAWRWAREVAVVTGACDEGQFLDAALSPTEAKDPWTAPIETYRPSAHQNSRAFATARLLLPAPGRAGVGLLPPPVPERWLADPEMLLEYDPADPHHDPALHHWIGAFRHVAERHGFDLGTKFEPDSGRKGLAGLYSPRWVRLCFPAPGEIVALEQAIVDMTIRQYLRNNERGAGIYLRDVYGLSEEESTRFMPLVKAEVRSKICPDRTQARAEMRMRVEDFIRRARKAGPLGKSGVSRDELMALKLLAVIDGLGQPETDQSMKEILAAFETVAKSQTGLPSPTLCDVLDVADEPEEKPYDPLDLDARD